MVIQQKKLNLLFTILLNILLSANNANAIYLPKINIITNNQQFIGYWKMKTVVIKSNCPYVIVGSTTESELEIKENKNELTLLWKGGNWTESIGEIEQLNEKEAIVHRSTEMKSKNNDIWKAELIDHLYLNEEEKLHSESIVKQYKNGVYIGEYKTFSILSKNTD